MRTKLTITKATVSVITITSGFFGIVFGINEKILLYWADIEGTILGNMTRVQEWQRLREDV